MNNSIIKSPKITFKVSEITNNKLSEADKLKFKNVILTKKEAEELEAWTLTINKLTKLQLKQLSLSKWIPQISSKNSKSIITSTTIKSAKTTATLIKKDIEKNSITKTIEKVFIWIMLWFKKIFGWFFWYFDNLFNPKNNKKEKRNSEKEKINSSLEFTKYTIWINILLWIAKKDTEQTFAILINPQIRNKSYNELWIKTLSIKDKKWIWEKYWLEGRDEEVYNTLILLKWKEKYLDKLFSKNFSNWRDKSLQDVMTYIYKFSKILENIKWITLEDFFNWNFEMFSLTMDWTDEWSLNELLNSRQNNKTSKLYGVENIFLIAIYENKSTDFSKDLLSKQEWANKEFIDDFVYFKKNIGSYISSYFYAWEDDNETKTEFKNYFNSYNYTQRDILELYILTNWDLNGDNLNDLEKGLMFMKVFKMLKVWSLRWKTYSFAIKEGLLNDSSKYAKMIPDSFKNTLLSYIKETGEKLLDTTVWLMWEIWSMLDAKEKSILIAMWVWLVVGFVALWRFMWMAKWAWLAFTVIAWVEIISNIYDYLEKNKKNDFNNILKKYNIKTKKDFQDKFWYEIEKSLKD